MVKFVAGENGDPKGKKIIGLGFSLENLERLKKGLSLSFSLGELITKNSPFDHFTAEDEIFIFADENDEKIKSKIMNRPWITKNTEIIDKKS